MREPERKVAARWIVHEVVDRGERYLLVEGRVDKGEEADPPAEADYVVLRQTTEAEAASSKLPVRTLTIPHFYALPESFTVVLTVQTEPAGGKVYQVLSGGALVLLGAAPAKVSLIGSISDSRVVLANETWMVETAGSEAAPGGLGIDLWAANSKLASSSLAQATAVALLTANDLSAIRKGKKTIEKHTVLALRDPLTAETQSRVHLNLTIDGAGR